MSSPPSAARQEMPGPERLTYDALTGLRNEHLFRLQLPTEFSRARDGEANGALVAIKLDNIVAINAQHGRSGGDEALRAVAYILDNYRSAGAAARESHVVFKLSGPVFGYYLPVCGAPEARRAAEQLRDLVTSSELYIGRLTVSIAVVNFYEFFLQEGTREEIALHVEQAAFQRLGIAERAGGNTICDSSDVAEAAAHARPVVLIVDPQPASVEMLVRALEAAEFTVKTCADGESAVAFIQSTPPGLVIAEAMTPRLNGFTIRDRMRANALWNAIPFILVSHKKTEEFIRMAAEGKILHFLKKPLSVAEVVGLATNLTRNRTG